MAARVNMWKAGMVQNLIQKSWFQSSTVLWDSRSCRLKSGKRTADKASQDSTATSAKPTAVAPLNICQELEELKEDKYVAL